MLFQFLKKLRNAFFKQNTVQRPNSTKYAKLEVSRWTLEWRAEMPASYHPRLPTAQYSQLPPRTLSSGILRNSQTAPTGTNLLLKTPCSLSWRRSPEEIEQKEGLGGTWAAQVIQQCGLLGWANVTKRKGPRSGNEGKCGASPQLPLTAKGKTLVSPSLYPCSLVLWAQEKE